MPRSRSITPVMVDAFADTAPPVSPALQWSVSDDGTCHSLAIPGEYHAVYETARAAAYARIGTLAEGTLLHPPGIVGRGDHVYVELHVRPASLPVVDLA